MKTRLNDSDRSWARGLAADGAAWLDVSVPGWAQRLGDVPIDISSCTKCVVGRLGGVGEETHKAWIEGAEKLGIKDYKTLVDLGFGAHYRVTWDWDVDALIEYHSVLSDQWNIEIAKRLGDSHDRSGNPGTCRGANHETEVRAAGNGYAPMEVQTV